MQPRYSWEVFQALIFFFVFRNNFFFFFFSFQWFLMMFFDLPFPCVVRVWDYILTEGHDVSYFVALAILHIFRGSLKFFFFFFFFYKFFFFFFALMLICSL